MGVFSYNDQFGWHYKSSYKEAEEEMLDYIKNVMKVDFPYPDNYYYQMIDIISKEKGKPMSYKQKLEERIELLEETEKLYEIIVQEQKNIIENLKKQIFDLTGCIVLEDLN